MSEYPIGLHGEMIHCLDTSDYAQLCISRLEEEVGEWEGDINVKNGKENDGGKKE